MFDFKNPDYVPVFRARVEALNRLNQMTPSELKAIKTYYKDHIPQFINDWGMTFDPRNVEVGLPAAVPFILFPKQAEWIDWLVDLWKTKKPGLTEKTRDMGMSWLSVATACSLAILYPGFVAGFGSRKEEYVDKLDSPKSLFWKARQFINLLPPQLRAGWDPRFDAPHMRIKFPETGSHISGEAGTNIGRGDRTSIYFVDEAAFLEQPGLVEASLSATTNCRQDISTPCGMNNPFAYKRHSGKVAVFTFHWRDDPRKDQAWYDKIVEEINNPVIVAQEIDINYAASVEGVLIPAPWVMAAIDAHEKLGIKPTGAKWGALDVADEGGDLNSFCGAHGILIERMDEWSGKGDDIFGTVQKTFAMCDELGYDKFRYDADGLGAGVRGDARIINEQRAAKNIVVEPFRGSESVFNPKGQDIKGRTNEDMFANCKAQSWWHLRVLFQNTYRAVAEGKEVDPDQIISISSKLRLKNKLVTELSQPTYSINTVGKFVVDKKPDGARSPNCADAVMIRFARRSSGLKISKVLLQRSRF